MTKRLIEEWLPIAEIGIEGVRERTPISPFPAPNRLHLWWARRPLVASRAAILASLLPADTDKDEFKKILGIHGDPVNAQRLIEKAKRTGERVTDPYGYERAFRYTPSESQQEWILEQIKRTGHKSQPKILDPTAGGGAIPFEALRLGFSAVSNDINPVACLTEKATMEFPLLYGQKLLDRYKIISAKFLERYRHRLKEVFPSASSASETDTTYLWSRTICCPYCQGLVPLSPNWKLAPDGTGVKIIPHLGAGPGDTTRHCNFEIVRNTKDQSEGTMKGGSASCPYPDCGRVIDGDQVKAQAQAGDMAEQLFAVVFKKQIVTGYTKATKKKPSQPKIKWERGYRAPRPEDDNRLTITAALADSLPEWEAMDLIPSEAIPAGNKTAEPIRYGMQFWRDLFSPRQLLCHGTGMSLFRELLSEEKLLDDTTKAAYAYLAIAIDKLLDWNSRLCMWNVALSRVSHTFSQHAYPFKPSYAEMNVLMVGGGLDWSLGAVEDCLAEIIGFLDIHRANIVDAPLLAKPSGDELLGQIEVNCGSGDELSFIGDSEIDAVVVDPPYYDNVMYAELSDFFYVWLKRTAGFLYPELFMLPLTDKENEAVANPALHNGKNGAKALAGMDYQQKMGEIFTECHRVLKDDGVMTLMFTHKATGAWDALTKGLIDAGFVITASWPINTEFAGSMHIHDKSAANSTIFLVCRPRPALKPGDDVRYWEDLEPRVKAAVRQRIEQFQAAGIRGVDLYLSCFGPALEEFSLHWPIKRGQPKKIVEKTKKSGRAQMTLEELLDKDDPYAVSPEDALEAARREVKAWRMEKLTSGSRRSQLDPLTEWFVLAWDAFQAPQFPFDEALRLARVVGLDLDKDVVGVLAEKKTSDLILWDSSTRATKGKLGAPDGTKSWIDAIHHCAHRARSIDLNAAKQLLDDNGLANSPIFLTALEAVLEVLPLSARYTGFDPVKAAQPAASDFEALENLRRLALAEQVPAPKQLELVLAEMAEA